MSDNERKKLISSPYTDYGSHESERSEDRLQEKIPYPRSVFFIIVNEFCERFSFYGMRAILTLYLHNVLKFSEDSSTMIYHTFIMSCYFTPLFGGILADSLLGKFRTILYLSIVYAFGNLVLSAAATPPLALPPIPFSLLGLFLIALGTGGIKPNVISFGGDQFQIPGQETQLHTFFSLFYFSINSGSLLSTFITPIVRQDFSCFGDSTCYSLAFGMPAILMITALAIFLVGKSFYKIGEPEGNLIVQIAKCIWHAISNLRSKGRSQLQNHWLDSADDKYEREFIADIKTLLRISLLFIPIPIFYSLLDQPGSQWTFQATRMDGRVFGWTIKPDQMQVANSLLVLLFIPIFDKIVYSVFARCNFLKEQLQRIIVGGFLLAISFILSGAVELQLEPTYPVLPGISQTSLNFVNTLPCTVNITLESPSNYTYGPQTVLPNQNFIYEAIQTNSYIVQVSSESDKCELNGEDVQFEKIELTTQSSKSYSILLGAETTEMEEPGGLHLKLIYSEVSDELEKSLEGKAKLRIITSLLSENITFRLESLNAVLETTTETNDVASSTNELNPDIYSVQLLWNNYSTVNLGFISLEPGGSYLLSVSSNYTSISIPTESLTTLMMGDIANENLMINLYTLTKPNSIHMLWLFPQYVTLTMGEVLVAITLYNFSYTKAPKSMKSVVQSLSLLANGIGSVIVIIVTALNLFDRQAMEFFLYSGLITAANFVFIWLSKNFKSKEIAAEDEPLF